MEDMIQEKVAQKENELNATYDERLRNYEERYVRPLCISATLFYPSSSSPISNTYLHAVNKISNARSP
jgi:hypothetical protein